MTRGARHCRFSSFCSRRLAAPLSRRLWTSTSSTMPSWSTARQSQCFTPAILRATSSRCHVWMPPFAQEDIERLDHVVGCGHVLGLHVRPDRAAGRYGDMRTWRKSLVRALSSLAPVAFPGPDLTDHLTLPFVDLLTRPTFPKPRRPMLAQIRPKRTDAAARACRQSGA